VSNGMRTLQLQLPTFPQSKQSQFIPDLFRAMLKHIRRSTPMNLKLEEVQGALMLTVTVPSELSVKEVASYAKACLRSIGVDGEPELIADK
jgi:hypothetical protein